MTNHQNTNPGPTRFPSTLAEPFSVTWQSLKLDDVKHHIAQEAAPDFQFWYVHPQYDPLQMKPISYYHDLDPSIDQFYPDPDAHNSCLALQIDLLRPQADLIELRWPRGAHDFMLDLCYIAWENICNQPLFGSKWIAFSSTTLDMTPLTPIRRTLFFPEVEHLNLLKQTTFEDTLPHWDFANAFENWLNTVALQRIEYRFWEHNMRSDAGLPPTPNLDATIFWPKRPE